MAFQPVSPVVWVGRWWVGDSLSFTWLLPFRAAAFIPAGPVSASLSARGGSGLFPQPFGTLPCSFCSHEQHREGRRGYIASSSVVCPPINDTTEEAMAIFGAWHPFISTAEPVGAILRSPGTSSKTPLVLGEGRERRWVFPFSILQFRVPWMPLGRGIMARKDVWPWPTSSVCVPALGRWGGTQVWRPGEFARRQLPSPSISLGMAAWALRSGMWPTFLNYIKIILAMVTMGESD